MKTLQEQAKEVMPWIQAMADGKVAQFRVGEEWHDFTEAILLDGWLKSKPENIRIKPQEPIRVAVFMNSDGTAGPTYSVGFEDYTHLVSENFVPTEFIELTDEVKAKLGLS